MRLQGKNQEKTMIHKIVRVFSPLSKDNLFVSLAIIIIRSTANI